MKKGLYSLIFTALAVLLLFFGCKTDSASSNADLSGLSVGEGTLTPAFDAEVTSYTVSVDNAVTSISVEAEAGDEKAAVAIEPESPVSLNVGDTAVTVTVTAENGTQKQYVITVTRAASSAKAITAFGFNALSVTGTINEADHTITAVVPYGTDVTALTATFTTTGASVSVGETRQVSGETANSFTGAVTYTVTAADGTSQSYTVTVTFGAPGDYTVTFDKNASDASGTMAAQTITRDDTENLTACGFSRAGYTFAGWSVTPTGTASYADEAEYTMGSSNVILYAKWTVNTYTITFKANGGTGSDYTQVIGNFETKALSACTFNKTGYTFVGWAATAAGSTSYADEAEYTMGTADVTLYARWVSVDASPASDFTYELINDEVTIKKYNGSAVTVVIPEMIKDENTGCYYPVTVLYSASYYTEGIFYNNGTIETVRIPDTVTSIVDYTFHKCTGLTSVILPDSVTSIGYYAFNQCTGLTSVTMSDSLTSIGSSAFNDCTSLTSVTLPDSLTSIGNYAFYDCEGLTSVTIPELVTSLGAYAFAYCGNLAEIKVYAEDPPTLGDYAFSSNASGRLIYVPSVSVGDYTTEWSAYAADIRAMP